MTWEQWREESDRRGGGSGKGTVDGRLWQGDSGGQTVTVGQFRVGYDNGTVEVWQ